MDSFTLVLVGFVVSIVAVGIVRHNRRKRKEVVESNLMDDLIESTRFVEEIYTIIRERGAMHKEAGLVELCRTPNFCIRGTDGLIRAYTYHQTRVDKQELVFREKLFGVKVPYGHVPEDKDLLVLKKDNLDGLDFLKHEEAAAFLECMRLAVKLKNRIDSLHEALDEFKALTHLTPYLFPYRVLVKQRIFNPHSLGREYVIRGDGQRHYPTFAIPWEQGDDTVVLCPVIRVYEGLKFLDHGWNGPVLYMAKSHEVCVAHDPTQAQLLSDLTAQWFEQEVLYRANEFHGQAPAFKELDSYFETRYEELLERIAVMAEERKDF